MICGFKTCIDEARNPVTQPTFYYIVLEEPVGRTYDKMPCVVVLVGFFLTFILGIDVSLA